MQHFCADITASKTAILLGINRNTINRYFHLLHYKIAASASSEGVLFSGEIECDVSYFGARRIRGRRGAGAARKTPVFRVLNRNRNIHVEIAENFSKESLMPIIQAIILEGSTVYTHA